LRFVKDRKGHTKRDAAGKKQKGDMKRSFRKIVEAYGELITNVVQAGRPLEVSDFANDRLVSEFVTKVVNFQKSTLASLPPKYKKYAKFAQRLGKDFSSQENLPVLLMAPYFSVEDPKWVSVNIDLIGRTKKISSDLPTFATIAAPLDRLAASGKRLVEQYKTANPDGFFLWVDDFSGTTEIGSLRVVRNFVRDLATLGKPIVALYGDAYCLVLKHFGLTGFACGICYGEKRSVDQDTDVEGQIPPRYYIAQLKKKIEIETEARRRDPSKFPSLRCPCDVCTRTTNLADLDEAQTREHFMLARSAEVAQLRNGQTAQAMAKELQQSYEEFKNELIFAPVYHLNNWSRLITEP
jgi:hypothetical protein